jgi:hypothetical protein
MDGGLVPKELLCTAGRHRSARTACRQVSRLAGGVIEATYHISSAFRTVSGSDRATVATVTAAGVSGNYLDSLCFSLEWGKREGGEALVAWSFYIFEARSGSSDGFRQR